MDREAPTIPIRLRTEALSLLLVLAGAAALWGFGVGRLDIDRSMEASRALVARQMIRSGDWVVPRRGEAVYLAKPPLFYWTVALLSRATGGVTAATVRWVSVLCALGVLLILHLWVRVVAGPVAGLVAAIAGAACPLAFGGATSGLVNMMLAFGTTLALAGAFFLLESPRRRSLSAVACGTGLAVGLMTKGPIVLLFFLPAVLVYVGFRRGGRLTESPRRYLPWFAVAAAAVWLVSIATPAVGAAAAILYVVPAGMLVFFALHGPSRFGRTPAWFLVLAVATALVLPWPLLLAERLGLPAIVDALRGELWRERLVAIGSSNVGPIWLYAIYFPAAVLPLSLLVPLTFAKGYGQSRRSGRDHLVLLARCWLIGSLVLFSMVGQSRKMRYLIPAFPPAAILAADVIVRARARELGGRALAWVRGLGRASVWILAAAPVVLGAVWLHAGLGAGPGFIVLLALPLVGLVAVAVLHRRGRDAVVPLVAVTAVLFGAKVYLHYGEPVAANARHSVRPACARLTSRVPAGDEIRLAGLPSVSAAFYLDSRPWEPLARDAAALARRDHVFVCVPARDRDAFRPPDGFVAREVDRAGSGGEELVLLRLQRTPSKEKER